MFKQIAIAFFSFLVGIVSWEHGAKSHPNWTRPSTVIASVALRSQQFFEWIGVICAHISGFYTYIINRGFYQTLCDLAKPTGDLFMSWAYVVKGYFSTVNLYDHPYLVFFGSLTLICLILYALHRTRCLNRFACYRDIQAWFTDCMKEPPQKMVDGRDPRWECVQNPPQPSAPSNAQNVINGAITGALVGSVADSFSQRGGNKGAVVGAIGGAVLGAMRGGEESGED
jgi:hypothetical protein